MRYTQDDILDGKDNDLNGDVMMILTFNKTYTDFDQDGFGNDTFYKPVRLPPMSIFPLPK